MSECIHESVKKKHRSLWYGKNLIEGLQRRIGSQSLVKGNPSFASNIDVAYQ